MIITFTEQTLRKLLEEALRTGAAYSLDYADLDFMGHPFGSVLKMRCIMTLGGLQWCFKEVHNTIEGSGDYYELKYESKMKEIWFRKLCYFHRRTPFAEKLEAFRAKSGKTQNEPRYGFILQTD